MKAINVVRMNRRIGGQLGFLLTLDAFVFRCRWSWLCDRIDRLAVEP